MIANGRSDDGSVEYIVYEKLAERVVLNGIGRMTKMVQVAIHVSLKDGEKAQNSMFYGIWTPPRTILKFSAVPLTLINVSLLVADADLAAEDVLIGLPVLRHLGVDANLCSQKNRGVLDGADCLTIQNCSSEQRWSGHPTHAGKAESSRSQLP